MATASRFISGVTAYSSELRAQGKTGPPHIWSGNSESKYLSERQDALMWKRSLHPPAQLKSQVDLATDTVNLSSELGLQDCSVALPGKRILVIFSSADIKVCVNTLIELKHMHKCVDILGKKTLDDCSLWLIPEELRYTERALKHHMCKHEHRSDNHEKKKIRKHIPFSPNENCGIRTQTVPGSLCLFCKDWDKQLCFYNRVFETFNR